MTPLHIALQDGFTGDTVVINVNSKLVFEKKNVRTRTQIGLADSFETEVEEGSVSIEVKIPEKGLSEKYDLQFTTATYVGVSIDDHQIKFKISQQPFGYL
jgi:hypothetical protein